MSRSVPVVRVIYPELDVNNQRDFTSLQGASSIIAISYSPNSLNNSNLTFTMTPPNQDVIVSRRVLKKFSWTCTITGTLILAVSPH